MKRKKAVKKSVKAIEKESKNKKNPQAREFWWVIGTMLGLVVVFFIFYWFFQGLNHFTYEGLAFTKEKFGQIPVFHYYYYFKDSSGERYQYNLYLRQDPRRNFVPIDGEIVLSTDVPVYISIDSRELAYCPMSSVAVSSLSAFLTNNLLDVKSGIAEKTLAKELNRTYVSCDTNPDEIVIVIQDGNITEITKKQNCHIITATNCEILPAAEKFILQSIIDAKNRKKF